MEEIKMKIIYNKNDKINAPVENPPEQQTFHENNSNITLKEILVIFIISLLIFPIGILIQNIIKIF